jgi:hypothetical protein
MGWTARVPFPAWQDFLFSTASRPTLGPTNPPILWVPEAISAGIKRPGREADHLPPSSAEVDDGVAIPPLPRMSSWQSVQFIKHRNKFNFTLRFQNNAVSHKVWKLYIQKMIITRYLF